MTLQTTPLHPDFGVEIAGVDLSTLDDATFEEILDRLLDSAEAAGS